MGRFNPGNSYCNLFVNLVKLKSLLGTVSVLKEVTDDQLSKNPVDYIKGSVRNSLPCSLPWPGYTW